MANDISLRDNVIFYIMDNYAHAPEYLWAKFPSYCIFRCPKNKKWYAIIMNVKKKNLGLNGEGKVDVLNVKAKPNEIGLLTKENGILPSYHLSKKSWISILLDGAIDKERIFELIDLSYEIVEKGK